MANRPQTPLEWAEQATAEDVEPPPTAERSDGYDRSEPRPHDQWNYIHRQIYRWLGYFDDFFSGTNSKLDIIDSVGAFIGTDDESDFVGTTNATANDWDQVEFASGSGADSGPTAWAADVFQVLDGIVTGALESTIPDLGSIAWDLDIRDDDLAATPGSGYLAAAVIGAREYFKSDALEPATNPRVGVRDASGNLGEGGFDLDVLSQASQDGLVISDAVGNRGRGGTYQQFIRAFGDPDGDDVLPVYAPAVNFADPYDTRDFAFIRAEGVQAAGGPVRIYDDQHSVGGGIEAGYANAAGGGGDLFRFDTLVGTAGEGQIQAKQVQAPPSTGDTFAIVQDGGGKPAYGEATNIAKASCYVDAGGGAFISQYGCQALGLLSDDWLIEFENPPSDASEIHGQATAIGSEPTLVNITPGPVDASGNGNTTVGFTIYTYAVGASSLNQVTDRDFYLTAWWTIQ